MRVCVCACVWCVCVCLYNMFELTLHVCVLFTSVCKQLVFTPACIISVFVRGCVCKNLNESIVHRCLLSELVSFICPPPHTHTQAHTQTTKMLKHLLARCANPHQRLG